MRRGGALAQREDEDLGLAAENELGLSRLSAFGAARGGQGRAASQGRSKQGQQVSAVHGILRGSSRSCELSTDRVTLE
jgi:hypothetical protein